MLPSALMFSCPRPSWSSTVQELLQPPSAAPASDFLRPCTWIVQQMQFPLFASCKCKTSIGQEGNCTRMFGSFIKVAPQNKNPLHLLGKEGGEGWRKKIWFDLKSKAVYLAWDSVSTGATLLWMDEVWCLETTVQQGRNTSWSPATAAAPFTQLSRSRVSVVLTCFLPRWHLRSVPLALAKYCQKAVGIQYPQDHHISLKHSCNWWVVLWWLRRNCINSLL